MRYFLFKARSVFSVSFLLVIFLSFYLPVATTNAFAQTRSAQCKLCLLSTRKGPSSNQSVTVNVSSNVVWQDTGISLNSGDALNVSASGSWSADPGDGYTGPDGYSQTSSDNFLNLTDIGVCAYCATTQTPHWGALIGYIGNNPPAAGSYTSTSILPEAQKVFVVGSNFQSNSQPSGELWLTFNDDAYSANTGDNAGQVTATVTTTNATSITVQQVWTGDANNNPKTTFAPGAVIHYLVQVVNSGSSAVTATFTLLATGPQQIFSLTTNASVAPGTDAFYASSTVPTNAPGGAYTLTVTVTYNGVSSQGSSQFTVVTYNYDPGNYAGKSGFVSVGKYNEPNKYKYRNYCGPGASRVLISAWTSKVPSIDTLATEEKTNPNTGTLMKNMITPVNNAIGQKYYSQQYASSQGSFSNMIGHDILDNSHPLITAIVTIYGSNKLNGWSVTAKHIITIYGFDFTSPSNGYIYYYETSGTVAGTTATGYNVIDYNTFWTLVQQNDVQLA